MSKLLGLLSVFLLIGLTCAHLLVYDIKKSEKRAIAEIQAKSDEFQKGINQLTEVYVKHISDVREKIEPALEMFRKQLSGTSGFFEDTIEKLTDISIYKETCSIVSFREYVMGTYDMAHDCLSQMIYSIEREVNDVKLDTTKMSQEYSLMEERILNCKNIETDNEQIGGCIVKEATNAERNLQSLSKIILSVRALIQPYEAPIELSRCIAEKFTRNFKRKIDTITNCLGESLKDASEYLSAIQESAYTAELKIVRYINNLADYVESLLKNVENQIVPIVKNVDVLASKFREASQNFISTTRSAFKHFLDTILH